MGGDAVAGALRDPEAPVPRDGTDAHEGLGSGGSDRIGTCLLPGKMGSGAIRCKEPHGIATEGV